MQSNSSTQRTHFIHSLTGIRGFAALWVVYYHLRPIQELAYPDWTIFHTFSATGLLGVDLFSILSGFVISYTYSDKLAVFSLPDAGRYIWARIARIYPIILFMLFVFFLAFIKTMGMESVPSIQYDTSFFLQLFMLNGWGFESRYAWNVPSWTVSAEWFCYLCFPFLAPLFVKVNNKLSAFIFATATLGITLTLMETFNTRGMNLILDWGLIRIGGLFLTGCFLYRMYKTEWTLNISWDLIGLSALVAIYILMELRPAATFIAVILFAVIIYSLAHKPKILSLIFANRVSLYLGEISYSIYMVHWFIVVDLLEIIDPAKYGLSQISLMWILPALTIVVAGITNFLIERPAQSYMRKYFKASPTEIQQAKL